MMRKYINGFFALVVFPLLMLLTGCHSEGAFTVTTVKLERIDITASPITTRGVSELTLAAGNEQPFEAIGYYSDGSSQSLTGLSVTDWHSSNPDMGYFDDPGILVGGDTPGTVTVHVSKDGVTSNELTVNVTTAVIVDITVTPSPVNVAKNQTQQLTATATYSDDTQAIVSNSVTWMLGTNIASVTNTGLLTGIEEGVTTLTATQDGIASNEVTVNVSGAVLTNIMVSPSPINVATGQTQQLMATAVYGDGTTPDVTDSVEWVSVDNHIASIDSAGLLLAGNVGSTALMATLDGITSNEVPVTVSAAIITDITISPSPINVASAQTQQLTATATYGDGTTPDVTESVTWTPDDPNVATIDSTGLLTGGKVGTTTLTASMDGIISDEVAVSVSAAEMTDITVIPSSARVAIGSPLQLKATATYGDGTTPDVTDSVTWESDDPNIATINTTGLLVGGKVGTTTLTASKDGIISDEVAVSICADLAGSCIDIFDVGGGKLFTSSPSVAYLDRIGGTATDGIAPEDGTFGPTGDFYRFTWEHANDLCATYNTNSFDGRTNWRLTTIYELRDELYGVFGNMFDARGWPTDMFYWSVSPDTSVPADDYYFRVRLNFGVVLGFMESSPNYVSCVSDP